MNRCATCAHWQPVSMASGNDTGTCALTACNEGERWASAAKGSLAVARDAKAFYAVLHTSRRFGCVQWEQRA